MKVLALISFRHMVLTVCILLTIGCLFLVRYGIAEMSENEMESGNTVPIDLLAPDPAPEPPEDVPDFLWDKEDAGQATNTNGQLLT
ncbi:hypothetical protein P4E94_13360 [Pontiellaceae bacterium B12219]|nr:hypothetical protein [Pontiellaceae bacterium B12219]